MKHLKDYLIQFVGLKIGKHEFQYKLGNEFFEHFGYEDFNSAAIKVDVVFDKKAHLLEFEIKHKGTVNVPCDISNEMFDLKIKGTINIIVKFGDEFNDDNETLLIVPHGEYQVDISQYIYESIILSVPFKRVHPGIKDGTLESEAMEALEKYAPNSKQEEVKEDKDLDPRWDNLKKLLTDK